MLMAGKSLRSESLRSRMTSMLPVPLNSSKMTSSILLPVSMKRRCHDGEVLPPSDIAGSAEEPLGLVQGV